MAMDPSAKKLQQCYVEGWPTGGFVKEVKLAKGGFAFSRATPSILFFFELIYAKSKHVKCWDPKIQDPFLTPPPPSPPLWAI